MFLHESLLEELISPRRLYFRLFSLFLSWLRSAIAYLSLQVAFYLLGLFGPKREVFLVEAEKVIAIAI